MDRYFRSGGLTDFRSRYRAEFREAKPGRIDHVRRGPGPRLPVGAVCPPGAVVVVERPKAIIAPRSAHVVLEAGVCETHRTWRIEVGVEDRPLACGQMTSTT